MAQVVVGRIGRPHGVKGEVTLGECSLTPLELHGIKRFTWRGRDGAERALELATVRPAIPRTLVRFRGVESRDRASELTNGELLVESEALPDAGPGTAYAFQLVGLAVETEEGRRLGTLQSIILTGAHPVYVVQGDREWLIPATPEVLKHVDLAAGRITVALPAGLEEI